MVDHPLDHLPGHHRQHRGQEIEGLEHLDGSVQIRVVVDICNSAGPLHGDDDGVLPPVLRGEPHRHQPGRVGAHRVLGALDKLIAGHEGGLHHLRHVVTARLIGDPGQRSQVQRGHRGPLRAPRLAAHRVGVYGVPVVGEQGGGVGGHRHCNILLPSAEVIPVAHELGPPSEGGESTNNKEGQHSPIGPSDQPREIGAPNPGGPVGSRGQAHRRDQKGRALLGQREGEGDGHHPGEGADAEDHQGIAARGGLAVQHEMLTVHRLRLIVGSLVLAVKALLQELGHNGRLLEGTRVD
mmetsp:Transcript_16353/g.36089  ORF Transcript_16353/g.36089 Transcript_16353/m.36089 type:complete len:295 (-) Transcript_16353:685-1569(-)